MPLMRASSSAVVPNCWAMDDRESPDCTTYSLKGDGWGIGVGVGDGVPSAVAEAAAVAVGVAVTVAVAVAACVGVAEGVAVGLPGAGVVARGDGVVVGGGRAASPPDSPPGRPGGCMRSQRARMEATRRASREPRKTVPEGMALAGS
jgi:hypothetical protein